MSERPIIISDCPVMDTGDVMSQTFEEHLIMNREKIARMVEHEIHYWSALGRDLSPMHPDRYKQFKEITDDLANAANYIRWGKLA